MWPEKDFLEAVFQLGPQERTLESQEVWEVLMSVKRLGFLRQCNDNQRQSAQYFKSATPLKILAV